MTAVTSDMVKALRDTTGAGVMECKRALEEAGGDFEKAQTVLKEKGLAAAAKRQERETYQGVVECRITGQASVGVLVEVNCETDFVAKTDEFKELAASLASHVEASFSEQRSPVKGADAESALRDQPMTGDAGKTVGETIKDAIARTGENIKVSRFVRYERKQPGVLESYIHAGGRIGVLVEVSADSDGVAQSDDFKQLARDIAMQIAAMNPQVISKDDRTPELEGNDAEVVLLEQPYIKDMGKTIGEMVQEAASKSGEQVRVSDFQRFELGADES